MNRRFRLNVFKIGFLLLLLLFAVQACVYQTAPPPPSNYDRAWDAALRAAQETGINLATVDRNNGLIAGSKDGIDVTITVRPQADGTTRVASSFKGQMDRDPTLSRRFDSAYERNMGR